MPASELIGHYFLIPASCLPRLRAGSDLLVLVPSVPCITDQRRLLFPSKMRSPFVRFQIYSYPTLPWYTYMVDTSHVFMTILLHQMTASLNQRHCRQIKDSLTHDLIQQRSTVRCKVSSDLTHVLLQWLYLFPVTWFMSALQWLDLCPATRIWLMSSYNDLTHVHCPTTMPWLMSRDNDLTYFQLQWLDLYPATMTWLVSTYIDLIYVKLKWLDLCPATMALFARELHKDDFVSIFWSLPVL